MEPVTSLENFPVNIHQLHNLRKFVLAIFCQIIVAPTADIAISYGSEPPEPRFPLLQSVRVANGSTFFFDFDVHRGPGYPNLIKCTSASGMPNEAVQTYLGPMLFGFGAPPNTVKHPVRWDIVDNVMYSTGASIPIPQPTGPLLYRFPLAALTERPDPSGHQYPGSIDQGR
jgi:hypothetical protein